MPTNQRMAEPPAPPTKTKRQGEWIVHRTSPACASMCFFLSPVGPVPASRQARGRAANQYIRENRKHECGDQRFSRVKPAQNKELIDRVHHKREDDNSAYSFQSFAEVACPLRWIGQDGPRVKWPAGPRIFQSVADGEDSRHD